MLALRDKKETTRRARDTELAKKATHTQNEM